ncbi:MAG: flagella basal body P-ring formation protein FlgA [Alphaproteobacteria bacterium]|jgi:flagella basal body P-ring formation protein FlgA
MYTEKLIKGTMIAVSFTLLMMAAGMANADETAIIPTLKVAANRGDMITSNMLTELSHPKNQITSTIIRDADNVVGMETTRRVRAGYPLRNKQFRIAPTVKKGHVVTVVFQKAGVLLTTEGTVMNDAVAGDFVKIMNSGSSRLLRGIVQENGTIAVN